MRVITSTEKLEKIMRRGELDDVYPAPSYQGQKCVDLVMIIKGEKKIFRTLANI